MHDFKFPKWMGAEPRANSPWTLTEDQRLVQQFLLGSTPQQLAQQHGRAVGGVTSRLWRVLERQCGYTQQQISTLLCQRTAQQRPNPSNIGCYVRGSLDTPLGGTQVSLDLGLGPAQEERHTTPYQTATGAALNQLARKQNAEHASNLSLIKYWAERTVKVEVSLAKLAERLKERT